MADTPNGQAPSPANTAQEDLSRNPSALLVKLLRRVVLDCTLDELAERSGVNADQISRYEGGKIKPKQDNLNSLLRAAGVLNIRRSVLIAIDQVAEVLNPQPEVRPPDNDPLLIRQLLGDTSRRLILLRSPEEEEGRMPTTVLLVLFVRKVLLGCTLRDLSALTGIHENVLARYEAGQVERPSSENLDLILDAAGLLHLKTPLLRAMSDLAAVLARQSADALPENLLDRKEIDNLVAHTIELLRRKLPEE